MIDDDHRGYLMELMGTKLLTLPQPIQIIGMSATMSVSAGSSTKCREASLTAALRTSISWPVGSGLIRMRHATAQCRSKNILFMMEMFTRQRRRVSCSIQPVA